MHIVCKIYAFIAKLTAKNKSQMNDVVNWNQLVWLLKHHGAIFMQTNNLNNTLKWAKKYNFSLSSFASSFSFTQNIQQWEDEKLLILLFLQCHK